MADIDPDALLTASQLAAWFGVTVAAVTNWVARGHLKPAADSRGRTIKDSRGRPLYRLLDGAKAEAATARAAGRDSATFSPNVIDRMTGKTIPFTMAGMPRGLATVVAVKPATDGAEFTVDILDVMGDTLAELTGKPLFTVKWPC